MSEQTPEAAPHTPHSRHRAELRERAFELHCQLQSNRAISLTLGVPERTVRAWIKDLLDETTRGLRDRRVEFLREAVVGQRAIAAAAWSAFNFTLDHERARLTDEDTLSPPSRVSGKGVGGVGSADAAEDSNPLGPPSRVGKGVAPQRRGLGSAGAADEDSSPNANTLTAGSPSPRRERGSGGEATTIYRSARLLHVAFAAQREIAHLLRLYDDDVVPKQTVEILITRNPPWPEPDPDGYLPDTPDDPNERPDDHPGGGGATNHNDNAPRADPYAGTGLPDDLKPNGVDHWRELHGYPPRPLPGGLLAPNASAPQSAEPAIFSGELPHDREVLAPPSRVGGKGAGGLGSENPATPATALAPTSTPTPPDAPDATASAASPPAPDLTPPPPDDPQRPPYPIAWLFPPGAPIPRPYRNAPPRPDRAFFNNPLRW